MPRAKAQSSLSKNQMQLAIALSSSLEESKKLELSNLTEALPASTIEDGTVPQSIKQMQKEFLEQLKPKPGPSKKSRKPPKQVPTLLIRSSEERLRIITEKVALVLIKDDCYPSSAKDWSSFKLLRDNGQESALWSLSWMLSSDKNLYYIDCLATFISPSEAKTGSKLNNSISFSRTLTTPNKYKPFKGESLHQDDSSQASPYKENEFYNQKEADYMDPDFQAQTELQNDWQRMLNNSKFGDITIVVKERSHITAHKLVLFVRCPSVIEDLDDRNMLYWTTVTHIQAMAFLEYCYSGKLARIRALGGNQDGVVLLARKYKITELLKFLLISECGVEISDSTNCDLQSCSQIAEAQIKSGTISPDMFADPEETTISNDKQTISVNDLGSDPQISIEISSDEEGDELLKNFFGTYNPTVSSPILESDSDPEIEVHAPIDVLKETLSGRTTLSVSNSTLQQKGLRDSYKVKQDESDEDMFSSPKVYDCSSKLGYRSSERSINHASLNTNLLHVVSSSDEHLNESVNAHTMEDSYSTSQVSPSFSPKGSRKSLFQTSKDFDSNISNSQNLASVDSAEEDHSDIFSTPCTKRKQSFTEEIITHSSFYKKRRSLNESVSLSSSPKLTTAYCSDQNQSVCFDDSFNSIITRNFEQTFETKNVDSPKKATVLGLNKSDYNCLSQKHQEISNPSTNNSENERKLLEDSFKFDLNDSLLLRQTEGMQTPESKMLWTPLRTPLDNVKTSSPVTPMPDYGTMTNEQFEVELQRFGLKRGLSRSKGIKMLTHIYGKLHPLVEVVSHNGKELLIPLGEKTPSRPNEQSGDDEPLSQQSVGSSDDDCSPMLEETVFDEEEDLNQGVSSNDLKTAVRMWIMSQPDIHEMILSYEPIWLDIFHVELKSQFDKSIKVNQLMDVLDEEGITFRSAPGQQNRRKKRDSPRKKRGSPPKKLHTSPKKK